MEFLVTLCAMLVLLALGVWALFTRRRNSARKRAAITRYAAIGKVMDKVRKWQETENEWELARWLGWAAKTYPWSSAVRDCQTAIVKAIKDFEDHGAITEAICAIAPLLEDYPAMLCTDIIRDKVAHLDPSCASKALATILRSANISEYVTELVETMLSANRRSSP